MSDNWVVQNLENALETWNSKLSEIWQLLTTSPQQFKGGSIWSVMVNINGAVQAIGLALLVLFFVVGVVRTCGSFTDVKKPEHALKLFIRFAIAKGVITYGLELMLALFDIVQGTISTIMTSAGFGTPNQTTLPAEMVTTIESCGFFESIPLWAVTLIGGLFITVLSFIMIMTVYGRFFKLYMYTALAPIPLSTFAGEPSQNVGKSFIKSYCAVLLEGAVIVLACIIFSLLSDFWRIGSRTEKKLAGYGIHTMGDIAMASLRSEDWLYKMFGIDAELLIDHAWGYETCRMSDIKNYHSEEHSLSNGQVLMRNYSFDEALVIVREMTDNLVLDLFEKGLITSSLTLWIAYDHRYEHEASKGTVKLERESNSSKKIIDAVEDLYLRIADRYTGIRRIEVCANRVAPESYVQYSLFDNPKQTDKERHLQEAVLNVKQRYGKNAIMRGSNLLECSTYRERNEQIGGHRA